MSAKEPPTYRELQRKADSLDRQIAKIRTQVEQGLALQNRKLIEKSVAAGIDPRRVVHLVTNNGGPIVAVAAREDLVGELITKIVESAKNGGVEIELELSPSEQEIQQLDGASASKALPPSRSSHESEGKE